MHALRHRTPALTNQAVVQKMGVPLLFLHEHLSQMVAARGRATTSSKPIARGYFRSDVVRAREIHSATAPMHGWHSYVTICWPRRGEASWMSTNLTCLRPSSASRTEVWEAPLGWFLQHLRAMLKHHFQVIMRFWHRFLWHQQHFVMIWRWQLVEKVAGSSPVETRSALSSSSSSFRVACCCSRCL